MARYRLLIAYDGTDFHGWQKQHQPAEMPGAPRVVAAEAGQTPDGRPRRALRTVQQAVEDAVAKVILKRVPVTGASRTDSGVHARAQTVAFTAPDDRLGPPDERLAMALNNRLPDDALCLEAERVHDDFDPISDCIAKGYRYSVWSSRERPLWERKWVMHIGHTLDLGLMREAASVLVGEHDFAAFAAASHGRDSTVRNLLSCEVSREGDELFHIDVSANGFLYNMVRIIAGSIVEVGRGHKTVDDLRRALETGERRLAGQTMGPEGLCLMWGRYPEPVGTVGLVASEARQ